MTKKKRSRTRIVDEMTQIIVGHLKNMPVKERKQRLSAFRELIRRGVKRGSACSKAALSLYPNDSLPLGRGVARNVRTVPWDARLRKMNTGRMPALPNARRGDVGWPIGRSAYPAAGWPLSAQTGMSVLLKPSRALSLPRMYRDAHTRNFFDWREGI